jgi:3-hydroxy acid dehydrogenase / malonic semialdehyde reductase
MSHSLKVLVTGASSGIGQATALHLAQKGHQVLMAARRLDRLRKMAEESATVVGEFLIGELDVTKPESINSFIERNKNWLEGIDVLINNAGLALGRDAFQQSTAEDVKRMVDTNIWGTLEMSRRLLPFMIKRKTGHIINLGSIAGRVAYKGGTVYCATKAAVHMVTDALRMDLAGTGVRVTTLSAGRVETEFSLVRFGGDKERADKMYQGFRPITAKDMAETLAWVIERPAHVNVQFVELLSTDQPNATEVVPV